MAPAPEAASRARAAFVEDPLAPPLASAHKLSEPARVALDPEARRRAALAEAVAAAEAEARPLSPYPEPPLQTDEHLALGPRDTPPDGVLAAPPPSPVAFSAALAQTQPAAPPFKPSFSDVPAEPEPPLAREVEKPAPPVEETPVAAESPHAGEVAPSRGLKELRARPAPLWRRLFAGVVDLAIVGGLVALFVLVGSAVSGHKAGSAQLSDVDAVVERIRALQKLLIAAAGLAGVLSVAYATYFGIRGRTPGRALAGLRLVDKTGLAPTPIRAAVRAVLSLVSFAAFLGGFWLLLFDRRGQTLHDKLTSTFVVRPL